MDENFGTRLRQKLMQEEIMPFIGVYDVLSATLAAKYYEAIFISGFGFSASHYGLPDSGFISWTDIVNYVQKVRKVLPNHHILVDIDDGFGDAEVACHVVSMLESAGASGIVMEDQKRPKKCGHFGGKQLLDLEDYMAKLNKVLEARTDMFVVARTDASEEDEIIKRVHAFAKSGADAILVDGMRDLDLIKKLANQTNRKFFFNLIEGGKSRAFSLDELKNGGISMVIYSTPCLFAAQKAVETSIKTLKENDGSLKFIRDSSVNLLECNDQLELNLKNSKKKSLQLKDNGYGRNL